jgi:hypothetical protein
MFRQKSLGRQMQQNPRLGSTGSGRGFTNQRAIGALAWMRSGLAQMPHCRKVPVQWRFGANDAPKLQEQVA